MTERRSPLYKWLRGTGGSVVGGVIFFGFFLLQAVFGTAIAAGFALGASAIVGTGYFVSRKLTLKKSGVANPSSLSGQIAALGSALRARADALSDRFGRKPAEHQELALEQWEELKRVATLRGLGEVVAAVDAMNGGNAEEMLRSANEIERVAASIRNTTTPYHLGRNELVQAILILMAVGAGGGLLLRHHLMTRADYQFLVRAGITIEGTVVGQTTNQVTRSIVNQPTTTTTYFRRIVEYRIGSDVRRVSEQHGSTGSYELAKGMSVPVIYLPGRESEALLVDDLQEFIDSPRGASFYFGVGLLAAALLGVVVVWRMQVERN